MADVANITVGASQLFIAPKGTAEPTLTGAATDFHAFTALGLTLDGIEIDYTPTWKDIMADELMGPAQKILVSHKLVISCKLEETTLQNLAYAIPGATFAGTTLTVGTIDAPEFVLGWIGPASQGNVRECLVYRVVSIAAVKAHYQRKDLVTYSVQFEALSDTTKTAPLDLATIKDF
jgi:hypothetical protein